MSELRTIEKMIYDELIKIIPISRISFIPSAKTIQIQTQGRLISKYVCLTKLTVSEEKALKIIKTWSNEIYGI